MLWFTKILAINRVLLNQIQYRDKDFHSPVSNFTASMANFQHCETALLGFFHVLNLFLANDSICTLCWP